MNVSFPKLLPNKLLPPRNSPPGSNRLPLLRLRSRSPHHHLSIGSRQEEEMGLLNRRRAGLGALGAALIVTIAVVGSASAASNDNKSSSSNKKVLKFVRKTVSAHEIVIFSKSYCPYCQRAKDVFKELNKEPHVVELDQRDDGWDIQDALSEIVGRRTVPQVFINGKHLGGSDDTVESYESGKLAKLLKIDTKDDL